MRSQKRHVSWPQRRSLDDAETRRNSGLALDRRDLIVGSFDEPSARLVNALSEA
jgi:hypothetical protein